MVSCEMDFLDDPEFLLEEQEDNYMSLLFRHQRQHQVSRPGNLTEDEWRLRLAVEGEKARQLAIIDKIKLLEKYREKLARYAGKWDIYENRAQSYLNLSSQCDYACTRACFQNNRQTTVINTFVSCIVPQCRCMNSFALQFVPQPQYIPADWHLRRNDTIRNASSRVMEGWPQTIRQTINDIQGYDLIRDCDMTCHRDCFEIKKYVPFDALLQCPRYRCNCWYHLDQPIVNQISQGYFSAQNWTTGYLVEGSGCNTTCTLRCIREFVNQNEVDSCVRMRCGCNDGFVGTRPYYQALQSLVHHEYLRDSRSPYDQQYDQEQYYGGYNPYFHDEYHWQTRRPDEAWHHRRGFDEGQYEFEPQINDGYHSFAQENRKSEDKKREEYLKHKKQVQDEGRDYYDYTRDDQDYDLRYQQDRQHPLYDDIDFDQSQNRTRQRQWRHYLAPGYIPHRDYITHQDELVRDRYQPYQNNYDYLRYHPSLRNQDFIRQEARPKQTNESQIDYVSRRDFGHPYYQGQDQVGRPYQYQQSRYDYPYLTREEFQEDPYAELQRQDILGPLDPQTARHYQWQARTQRPEQQTVATGHMADNLYDPLYPRTDRFGYSQDYDYSRYDDLRHRPDLLQNQYRDGLNYTEFNIHVDMCQPSDLDGQLREDISAKDETKIRDEKKTKGGKKVQAEEEEVEEKGSKMGKGEKKGKKKEKERLVLYQDYTDFDDSLDEFDSFSITICMISLLAVAIMSTWVYQRYIKSLIGMGKTIQKEADSINDRLILRENKGFSDADYNKLP